MRYPRSVIAALALLGSALPAASQTTPPPSAPPPAPTTPVAPPSDPSFEKRAGDVVTGPLKDANIVKPKVSPVLVKIMDKPYDLDGMTSCTRIAAAVRELDGILGEDLDVRREARKRNAGDVGMTVAGDVIGSLIPGRGILRLITGADKEARYAIAASYAGSVRRAFLKGVGAQRKCKPPAAPLIAS